MQHIGHNKRSCNRADDNRQRLLTSCQHYGNIQTEAKQDYCVLQHLFGYKCDAALELCFILEQQRAQHTGKNAEYRTADNRDSLSQKPAGNGKDEA